MRTLLAMLTLSLGSPITPALLAQGFVSPAHFANIEANDRSNTGINSGTAPVRILQIHDDLKGTARPIASLAMRRNGPTTVNHPAFSVLADIFVSTAATPAATIKPGFDLNHGANKTQVGSFLLASFPATVHTGFLEPFDYKILFAQPFLFDGLNGLCWELRITSTTLAGAIDLDFANGVSTNPSPLITSRGLGCKATTYTTPVALTATSSPNWLATPSTINFSFAGSNLPKNALGYVYIGASRTAWGPLPLPFALPTASAPSGICTVYSDWLIQIPSLTNSTGNLTLNLTGVPLDLSYHGLSIYTQLVALDAGANAFGAVMSNSLQIQFIAPYPTVPAGFVYAIGSLAATGAIFSSAGHVTRFE